MNELLVQRVDRKRLPLDQRSSFSVAVEALVSDLEDIAGRDQCEVFVLSTCERFEVYFTSDNWHVRHRVQLENALRDSTIESGADAIRHLFRVASGIESRIPGETQILGQVRDALNHGAVQNPVRGIIADAFSYALRCGRRVRERTPLGHIDSSYVRGALNCLNAAIGSLNDAHIVVAGSGALSTEVAVALRNAEARQITIVGRHAARLEASAKKANAQWLTFDDFANATFEFDAMISAVSTAQPVITSELLGARRPRVVVDLGAAPNVASDVDTMEGVRVFRLDDLGESDDFAEAVAQAEAVVERDVSRFMATRQSAIWTRRAQADGGAHVLRS